MESFIALANEKNFSKAADKLYLAQSSFSSQIKSLETELNTNLVNRDNKKEVTLTNQGEIFLEFCKTSLNQYNDLKEKLCESSNNPIKKIGLFYTHRLDSWTQKISKHNEENKDTKFELVFSYGREKVKSILNNDVFISLSIENEEIEKKGYTYCPVYTDYESIGMPYGHPLADKDELTAEDLKKYIIYSVNPNRTTADTKAINALINKYDLKESNFKYKNRIGDLHMSTKTDNCLILMPSDLQPDTVKIMPLKFDDDFKITYGWYYKEMDDDVKWVIENLK